MKIIGFTGTQRGLTGPQAARLSELVAAAAGDVAIHGCCVGGDREFHAAIRPHVKTIEGYPGDPKQAVWGKQNCDSCHGLMLYMDRNGVMANRADLMFACPAEHREKLRSGTWATIRRRRRAGKPLTIIYPNGAFTSE